MKRDQRRMRLLVCLALSLPAMLWSARALYARGPYPVEFAGRYQGLLVISDAAAEVTTELEGAADQPISGQDRFMEPAGHWTEGVIQACRRSAPLTLLCRWRDTCGEGPLEMMFTPDMASFAGRWSSNSAPGAWWPWFGLKVSPAPTS